MKFMSLSKKKNIDFSLVTQNFKPYNIYLKPIEKPEKVKGEADEGEAEAVEEVEAEKEKEEEVEIEVEEVKKVKKPRVHKGPKEDKEAR